MVTKAFKVARLMEHYDGTFSVETERASIAVKGTKRSDIIRGINNDNQGRPVGTLGFSVTDVYTGPMGESMHLQVRTRHRDAKGR